VGGDWNWFLQAVNVLKAEESSGAEEMNWGWGAGGDRYNPRLMKCQRHPLNDDKMRGGGEVAAGRETIRRQRCGGDVLLWVSIPPCKRRGRTYWRHYFRP